jgi:hypothetical protein
MGRKRVILLLMGLFFALFVSQAMADDVVAELRLDKMSTKYSAPYMGTTFEPIKIYLVIKNLSDRIQSVSLKPKYHFRILKVSALASSDPQTFLPYVAEGDLTATYGKGYPVAEVLPHSEQVHAYGVIPTAITKRYTYKGYILPGAYIIACEFPQGLAGNGNYTKTESFFFIE